jgi:hypothetical protein
MLDCSAELPSVHWEEVGYGMDLAGTVQLRIAGSGSLLKLQVKPDEVCSTGDVKGSRFGNVTKQSPYHPSEMSVMKCPL